MKKNVSWIERYEIALCESLTVKDIMKLRNVGQPNALLIRKQVIEYCLMNKLDNELLVGVPTEIVLLVTGYDLNYYFNKMKLQVEMQAMLK